MLPRDGRNCRLWLQELFDKSGFFFQGITRGEATFFRGGSRRRDLGGRIDAPDRMAGRKSSFHSAILHLNFVSEKPNRVSC
jgi:hypothetical protein